MASPWRGNKQTKQQQRRRRQHQIGKSKLHVLHGRRWTRSSSSFSSGSGPVAFLVSRKFTAASHPFCLGSLCVASSALFVYFFVFFLSPFSLFCCTGILFVGEFFTDLCAGSSWQGYVRVSGPAAAPADWPESVGTKSLTGKNQS